MENEPGKKERHSDQPTENGLVQSPGFLRQYRSHLRAVPHVSFWITRPSTEQYCWPSSAKGLLNNPLTSLILLQGVPSSSGRLHLLSNLLKLILQMEEEDLPKILSIRQFNVLSCSLPSWVCTVWPWYSLLGMFFSPQTMGLNSYLSSSIISLWKPCFDDRFQFSFCLLPEPCLSLHCRFTLCDYLINAGLPH